MSGFNRAFTVLSDLAAFLLAGTVLALVWANLDYESYHHFVDAPLFVSELLNHTPPHTINFHFIVNDVFMVLFFGIAMKEVSESFLPGGALSSMRKASMPAIATVGGVVGPIGLFFLLRAFFDPQPDIIGGWAIPTATDIAYCWLFAKFIFGSGHPAVTFLLVLAVLDDLIGMLIIATAYTNEVHPEWLLLVAAAVIFCEVMRRLGVLSFWPYVIVGGTLCWFGLHNTGVHAALALVPVVPFLPHAERDAGFFENYEGEHDVMNQFEHFLKPIVDVGLFGFGLANAGVVLTGAALGGAATWIIFLSLLVGKTVGIYVFALIGKRAGLPLPEHMDMKQMVVLGCVAGIGFTVALFVTTVSLSSGKVDPAIGDMLKLGALLSFAAGPIAYLLSKPLGVEKIHGPDDGGHSH